MNPIRPVALVLAVTALAFAHTPAGAQDPQAPATAAAPAQACVAILMPEVQGVDDATKVAQGAQALFVSYLTGPTLKSIALEARLPSQALAEARIKNCPTVVSATVTKKAGGAGKSKLVPLTAAASSASSY